MTLFKFTYIDSSGNVIAVWKPTLHISTINRERLLDEGFEEVSPIKQYTVPVTSRAKLASFLNALELEARSTELQIENKIK